MISAPGILHTPGYNYKLINYLIPKKSIILDFGCGTGIWKNSSILRLKKIYLYDSLDSEIQKCQKKYKKYKKVKILKKNYKKKLRKKKIDIIFVNSVIQYINDKDLNNFFKFCKKILKKNGKIIIGDYIKFPIIFEILLLPFFSFLRIKMLFKLIFLTNKKNKLKMKKIYRHDLLNLKYLNRNFTIRETNNLSDNKLRKTLVLLRK